MNETTTNNVNANDPNTAQFFADIMITMITEDPSKIIDALNDADMMIANDAADPGQTQHSLMAESIIHLFRSANRNIDGLADVIDAYDDDIHALIVAHLDTIQK